VVRVVTPTIGSITDRLREDWQLIDIMKELNLPKYESAGLVSVYHDHNGKPIKKINDWTKRNDHRHHAMDALTIAFTKPAFIQYLNNQKARSDKSSSIYAIERTELERRPDNGKIVFKAPMKNFRQEAKKQLESVLVSIKSKVKVTTQNKNKPRKKNQTDRPTVQTTLTPRGSLHNETVYGSRKQYLLKAEKVGAAFNEEKISHVAKKAFREALLERLMKFDGDPKKAFTGKNSLEKNPIWLDTNQTCHIPEKVDVLYMETIYTVRKPITKDLKIEKVLDAGIRRVLEERLRANGGDAAKAFANLDENPIWLNKEKGIAIKSVTINAGLKDPEPIRTKKDKDGKQILDENGTPVTSDYVQTAGNHHIAIFEDENGKLQEHVVSFYEATARRIQGLPVIDKDFNKELGWKFLFTLKQNEMFVFPSEDFNPKEFDLINPDNYEIISKHLYRVQKLSSKYYNFRHHLETNVEENNALKDNTWLRITNLERLHDVVKVRINNIGQIVGIGEY
jgi:CRISPR-associated endonuclease Csn1